MVANVLVTDIHRAVLTGNYLEATNFGPLQFACSFPKKHVEINDIRSAWNDLIVAGCIQPEVQLELLEQSGYYRLAKPAVLTEVGLDVLNSNRLLDIHQWRQLLDININVPIALFGGKAEVKQSITNTQIINVLKHIIESIDNSGASDEQKQEAKSKLKEFIEHPLVNTVLGGVLGAILTAL
ncbi:MAG: hypothetical protein ACE5I9_06485 [Candidatus Methylomirabilales bacterium]